MNILDSIDMLAKLNGFSSADDMFHLIASVDLSTLDSQRLFGKWREEDGTKEGLLKLKETISLCLCGHPKSDHNIPMKGLSSSCNHVGCVCRLFHITPTIFDNGNE
jgi:hypothetical protein